MTPTYDHILLDRDGAVVTVTMNRPAQRNALSLAHMRELTDALREIGQDRSLRAVILAGAGPAFCAGHDLREMRGADQAVYEETFAVCTDLMLTIQRIPQPVIAAVHALATAAGCQLVATCDLVVAAQEASFATPGVKIGLFCSTPMVALTRAVGAKIAMEMLLTGQPISAQEAKAAGLVNRVVPVDEVMVAARALADQVAGASGAVVGMGKAAFYRQAAMSTADAYALTSRVMVENAQLDDAQEGMAAFVEKRHPQWRHA
ncbi:MAG: enoyl-CoA hydratase [Austwickia sp.]|jgi:enoyl-CoA hydratase/carnithine racemase|nr:enoyl-CoA hydratase [Austwickia sp.]MBK9102443.1 enoyl-CoA hydratase [Austwickia sp.]